MDALVNVFIKEGESDRLEFKQSFDKESIETVCAAFANSKGGQISAERFQPYINQIKIFDQKVTIFNPVKLYGELTIDIEQLKTDSYPSRTRNKLIAEAFYLTSCIEKYGSGYQRIRKAIQDHPTRTFEYEESGGANELFKFVQNNLGLSARQISEQLEHPLRATERWLKQLKDENKIEFRGAPKTGGYHVSD